MLQKDMFAWLVTSGYAICPLQMISARAPTGQPRRRDFPSACDRNVTSRQASLRRTHIASQAGRFVPANGLHHRTPAWQRRDRIESLQTPCPGRLCPRKPHALQPVRVSGLPASAPDTISHPTKKEPDAQSARLTTPSARRPRTLSHSRPSAPSKSGGWNYHLHCKRPQGSRQQLRPHPGPQAPRHPGPPPHPQRSRPQRSCQQRRPHPHCTSVILSMPAVAAAGSGRIGAAWVVPEPPAKTRPAIPAANSTRNIVFTRFFHG